MKARVGINRNGCAWYPPPSHFSPNPVHEELPTPHPTPHFYPDTNNVEILKGTKCFWDTQSSNRGFMPWDPPPPSQACQIIFQWSVLPLMLQSSCKNWTTIEIKSNLGKLLITMDVLRSRSMLITSYRHGYEGYRCRCPSHHHHHYHHQHHIVVCYAFSSLEHLLNMHPPCLDLYQPCMLINRFERSLSG